MTSSLTKLTSLLSRHRVLFGSLLTIVVIMLAPMMMSDFRLVLLAKYLCFAMVAVGVGLAWGQGGMLTLGQGLFFGLGAYVMAIHMKLADAGPDGVPDFMLLYGSGTVPMWWEPFRSPVVTIIGVLAVPTLVAILLGWAVFARGVRGAYFAILSQALVAAFATLLIGQQKTTGGTNGLNNFQGFFGFALNDPANKEMLYYICAFILLGMVLVVRWIMHSFMGELLVAVRDQENRVRFLGYDPAAIKVFAFAVSALFAGIGGALFVPIVGIISPADVGVTPSILMLAGVVIGGRTTLLGPVLGTIGLRFVETQLSESYPAFWTYFQGALFIVVICFLPMGLGGLNKLPAWIRARFAQRHPGAAQVATAAGTDAAAGTDQEGR